MRSYFKALMTLSLLIAVPVAANCGRTDRSTVTPDNTGQKQVEPLGKVTNYLDLRLDMFVNEMNANLDRIDKEIEELRALTPDMSDESREIILDKLEVIEQKKEGLEAQLSRLEDDTGKNGQSPQGDNSAAREEDRSDAEELWHDIENAVKDVFDEFEDQD